MKIVWSEHATTQVREIFAYIAIDRPLTAGAILEGLLERADLIAQFPEQGITWGDGQRPELRYVIHGLYRTVYRIDATEVAILSLRHTRMRPADDQPSL